MPIALRMARRRKPAARPTMTMTEPTCFVCRLLLLWEGDGCAPAGYGVQRRIDLLAAGVAITTVGP